MRAERQWLAILMLAGCGTTDSVPVTPGELAVQVGATGTPPGAMLLTVSGGPITGVTVAPGLEGALSTNASGTHILLVGAINGGELGILHIPDRTLVTRYVVSIDQVADATTFALLDRVQWTATLVLKP